MELEHESDGMQQAHKEKVSDSFLVLPICSTTWYQGRQAITIMNIFSSTLF